MIIVPKASGIEDDYLNTPAEQYLRSFAGVDFGVCDGARLADAFRDSLEPVRGRYEKARRRDESFAEWMYAKAVDDKRQARIRDCGSWLWFRRYLDEDHTRLAGGVFCKQHLLCQLCAIRRGARLLQRYCERLVPLLVKDSRLRGYLVTYTVKDGPDLVERFQHLRRAMKQLSADRRRHVSAKGKACGVRPESCKALGGVWAIELKRGRNSGEWHPHCHQQWLCREEPDAESIAYEWKLATGDSHIVDVEPFYFNVMADSGASADTIEKQIRQDCKEITKYGIKFEDNRPEDCWEAFCSLRSAAGRQVRLAECFGLMRSVKMSVDGDEMDSDGVLSDVVPRAYVEATLRWMSGSGYVCSDRRAVSVSGGEYEVKAESPHDEWAA